MDYRKTAMSYLPKEASGLENHVAAKLFEVQTLLREVLSMDGLSDDDRDSYEADLRKTGAQLRSLRDAVYARVAE